MFDKAITAIGNLIQGILGTAQQQPPPSGGPMPPNPIKQMGAAAQQGLQPTDCSAEHLSIRPINDAGNITVSQEQFYQVGNQITKEHTTTKALTASGAVVDANLIAAICAICARYEAVYFFCHLCGLPLCRMCARVMEDMHGKRILCPAHLKAEIDRFDTWAAKDSGVGLKVYVPQDPIEKPKAPPPPQYHYYGPLLPPQDPQNP